MQDSVQLTVVICTYNRASVLQETLNSLLVTQADKLHKLQLLLVDNNSPDNTRAVIEQGLSLFPNATYLFERQQGLSHARNTGIAAAQHDAIAFIDDDVFFSPGWVEAVIKALDSHPEIACFAGQIAPLYEGGRPHWLPDSLEGVYSALELGDRELPLTFPHTPIGANMIIRRTVIDRIGGFDTELGRKGKNLLSNEELEFFRKADQAGFRSLYIPDACVQHRIPASRTTPEWFVRRYFWQGISDAQSAWMQESWTRLRWIGSAFKALRSVLRLASGGNWSPLRMRWHYQSLNPAARAKIHMFLGWALHSFRLAMTQGMPRHPSGTRRDWRTATETMLEHHHRASAE